jgi:antitoxin YefM
LTVLPLGDVKSHLSELVSRVHGHHERVTVTVHGRPSAVLIAPEDLERLEETLEIMRDVATMNRLAQSDAELARGECVSAEEFAEVMRQRRACAKIRLFAGLRSVCVGVLKGCVAPPGAPPGTLSPEPARA